MLSEPMTLYKLMILYLLKQVNTALAEHRITEFFLSREYTSYFTLRQALAELCEAGLVLANSTAYGSRYTASPEGLETLSFFGKRLSREICDDMDRFLSDNMLRIENERSVRADYHPTDTNEYRVRLELSEGNTALLSLELSVPEKAQAAEICRNFPLHPDSLYRLVLNELLRRD